MTALLAGLLLLGWLFFPVQAPAERHDAPPVPHKAAQAPPRTSAQAAGKQARKPQTPGAQVPSAQVHQRPADASEVLAVLNKLLKGDADGARLLVTLRSLPNAQVARGLALWVSAEAPLEQRMVALRILADVSGPEAVHTWLEILGPVEPAQLELMQFAQLSEGTLARVLRSHPQSFEELQRALDTARKELLPLIARSIGQAESADGLKLLNRLFGREPELDLCVLAQMSKLCERAPPWRVEEFLPRVRAFLNNGDWRFRREAAIALGRMRDVPSFPSLVALLDDADRRVRQGALWSLRRLSGLSWTEDDAAEWRRWFEEEMRWVESDVPRLAQMLESLDAAEVLEAIRELKRGKLVRDEVALHVAKALRHEQPGIVRAACASLGELGSIACAEDLIACLRGGDEGIRESAARALRQITGRDLESDPEVWEKALRP